MSLPTRPIREDFLSEPDSVCPESAYKFAAALYDYERALKNHLIIALLEIEFQSSEQHIQDKAHNAIMKVYNT